MRYRPSAANVSAALVGALALAACRIERVAPNAHQAPCADANTTGPTGELWVYTSIFRHVIDELDPLVRAALPNVTVHWYQAGSEKVTNRLETELAAGGTQADMLVTSDPFLYERLARDGKLRPHVSPPVLQIPRELVHEGGAYVTSRLSAMVLAYRRDLVGGPPRRFAELTDPRFANAVVLGDPLASGTASTWMLFMARAHGVEFFRALRKNGAVVAGGNAAVMQKLEGNEAKVGVVLLENALAAKQRGSPVDFLYPDDGTVVIPGYLAILASTRNPTAADALHDFFMSREGQRALVERGDLHAIDPTLPGPKGEPSSAALVTMGQPWDRALVEFGLTQGSELKRQFSEAFAR